jgi:hypothetical protein
MKTKTTIACLAALAALLLAAPAAMAQDEDEDLFGEDPVDDPVDDDTSIDEPATDEPEVETEAGASASGAHNLGVGFSSTVLGAGTQFGAGGIEIEYWLSETLAINGLGRLIFFSPDVDGAESQIGIAVGVGALLVVKQHGPASLMVGGRFLLGFTSGDAGDTAIALEGPLRLQMRLAERLSVHVEGGIGIGIGDQTALGGAGAESFVLSIGSQNVFGNAGLTAYF